MSSGKTVKEVINVDKRKAFRRSHRDNKATDKNIDSDKFLRKNEDIPTSRVLSDVLGSYTGVPEDAFDKPVQDADDL